MAPAIPDSCETLTFAEASIVAEFTLARFEASEVAFSAHASQSMPEIATDVASCATSAPSDSWPTSALLASIVAALTAVKLLLVAEAVFGAIETASELWPTARLPEPCNAEAERLVSISATDTDARLLASETALPSHDTQPVAVATLRLEWPTNAAPESWTTLALPVTVPVTEFTAARLLVLARASVLADAGTSGLFDSGCDRSLDDISIGEGRRCHAHCDNGSGSCEKLFHKVQTSFQLKVLFATNW